MKTSCQQRRWPHFIVAEKSNREVTSRLLNYMLSSQFSSSICSKVLQSLSCLTSLSWQLQGRCNMGKKPGGVFRRCYRFHLQLLLNESLNWISTKGKTSAFADCTAKHFPLMFPPLTGWALPEAAGLQRSQIFDPGIWSSTHCKGGCL